MRVISGNLKGRKILAPKKLPVRPTTDRAKEGIFNILNHQISFSDLNVLDLFSGTGNISYEFASRGSLRVTSIDKNKNCIDFIKKTSNNLNLDLTIIHIDAISYLEQNNSKFNLIFADPPYNSSEKFYHRIILLSSKNLFLNGLLIIEHNKIVNFSKLQGFSYERKYGNNIFSFFEF
mgnify:CR=1 FL=1